MEPMARMSTEDMRIAESQVVIEQSPAICEQVAKLAEKDSVGVSGASSVDHVASPASARVGGPDAVRPSCTGETALSTGQRSSLMHPARPILHGGSEDEEAEDENAVTEHHEGWSQTRLTVHRILSGDIPKKGWNVFDSCMGAIIIFNIVLMIVETDMTAECDAEIADECVHAWVNISNMVLLVIYTLESAMRMYAMRKKFFSSKWNLLDLTIVVCGWVGVILQDVEELRRVNILRLLRVARVIRVAKILKRAPTLMNMISGFVGAMQAMFWGLILILLMLVMWSLLAVELVYPETKKMNMSDDDPCREAFSTVMRATLTFFQTLVAGDSWGACSIGIIHNAPHLYIIFAFSLVTVQLGFTNLVLAVIVDKANEARDLSKEEAVRRRKRDEVNSVKAWRSVMQSMDVDGNGTLSLDELMNGYVSKPAIRDMLDHMHVRRRDLLELFRLMDLDESNDLQYEEFVDALFRAQTQDTRMYLMFMQLRLQKIELGLDEKMKREFNAVKEHISETISQHLGGRSRGIPLPISHPTDAMQKGASKVAPAQPATNDAGVLAEGAQATKYFAPDATHSAAPPSAEPTGWRAALGIAAEPSCPARPPNVVETALGEELRAMRLSLERRLDVVAEEIVLSASRLGARQDAFVEALCASSRPQGTPPPTAALERATVEVHSDFHALAKSGGAARVDGRGRASPRRQTADAAPYADFGETLNCGHGHLTCNV